MERPFVKGIRWDLAVPCLLALLLSLSLSSVNLPFEADQGGKAAKILLLSGQWGDLLPVVEEHVVYFEHYMSFYYFLLSAFRLLLDIDDKLIFLYMNTFSSFLFPFALYAFAKLYENVSRNRKGYVPILLLTFLCPPVLITFSYGNEVSLAFTFLLYALLLSTSSKPAANFMSGVLLSLSVGARPDYIFAVPAVLLFMYLRVRRDKQTLLRLAASFITGGLICGMLFFVLAIRSIPTSYTVKDWYSPPHWLLGLLGIYATFGPALWIMALMALGGTHRWKQSGIVSLLISLTSLVFLQTMFYNVKADTAKYFLVLGLLLSMLATEFVIDTFARHRFRLLAGVLMVALFCAFVTPVPSSQILYFGSNPSRGLPTGDNVVPLGNYISYYRGMALGELQSRYSSEILAASEAISNFDLDATTNAVFVGMINVQFVQYEAAKAGYRPGPEATWTRASRQISMVSFQTFLDTCLVRSGDMPMQQLGNNDTAYYVPSAALLRGHLQDCSPSSFVSQLRDVKAVPIYSSAYKTIPTVFRLYPSSYSEDSLIASNANLDYFSDLEPLKRVLFLEDFFEGKPACERNDVLDYSDNSPLHIYKNAATSLESRARSKVIYEDSQYAMSTSRLTGTGALPVVFALVYPKDVTRLLW